MVETSTREAMPKPRLARAERERRVLDAAAELFYARGVHEVGMDELIERTGLGKATVYRLYPSKDTLIGAYLDRAATTILARIDALDEAHDIGAREALRTVIDDIWHHVCSPGFRGCPFNNASIEFADPEHPARRVSREYRARLRERLVRLAADAGDAAVGDQLAVIIDGIYTNAAHLGARGPARAGRRLALLVLDTLEDEGVEESSGRAVERDGPVQPST